MNKYLTQANAQNASSSVVNANCTGMLASLRRGAARVSRVALAGGFACAALAALPAHAAPADTMIKAVKFDDVSEVNKQLSHGMDPNMTDDQGMPLLVLAAREKSDKVAAALVANPKTNIEITDKAGENAMMMASLNGDINIVQTLIA